MARKRAPEHDWICARCECPCDGAGSGHLGGGQNRRACKKTPMPVLRSKHEAMLAQSAADAAAALAFRRKVYDARPGSSTSVSGPY